MSFRGTHRERVEGRSDVGISIHRLDLIESTNAKLAGVNVVRHRLDPIGPASAKLAGVNVARDRLDPIGPASAKLAGVNVARHRLDPIGPARMASKSASKYRVIGTSPVRSDAYDKVTGKAIFGSDVKVPGAIWGEVLRSQHPHARILSIDVSEARKLPGVLAVITSADFPPVVLSELRACQVIRST